MDVSTLPWDKGLGVVFATALLIIFLDLTYRKIPRGLTRVRTELRKQTEAFCENHDKDTVMLQALVTSIERLDTAIAALLDRQDEIEKRRVHRVPRRAKKLHGPAGSSAKGGSGRPAR